MGLSLAITTKVPVTVISLFIVAVLFGVVFVVWQLLLMRVANRSRPAADPPPDVPSGPDAGSGRRAGAEATATAAEVAAAAARSAQQQLIELKRLRDQDLITGEEFAARRQAVIDSASTQSSR